MENNYSTGDAPPNYKPISEFNGAQDLRCYSASYASSAAPNSWQITDAAGGGGGGRPELSKGKSCNGSSWSLSDPELKRKKRIASYKAYTVEGKLKGSFKKSFRWIKERCARIMYGDR